MIDIIAEWIEGAWSRLLCRTRGHAWAPSYDRHRQVCTRIACRGRTERLL